MQCIVGNKESPEHLLSTLFLWAKHYVKDGAGKKEVEIHFGLQPSWRGKIMAHENGKQ